MKYLTPEALLLDLAIAFPGLAPELLPEETPLFPGPKIAFAHQVRMQDGCPMYLRPEQASGGERLGYSQRIHDGFTAWLEDRGWMVFEYDGPVHLIVPMTCILTAALAQAGSNEDVRAWCDEHLADGSPIRQILQQEA